MAIIQYNFTYKREIFMKRFISNVTQYFSDELINKTIKLFKFLIVYSIAFAIIVMGIKYAIPFVIAYFIAIAVRPLKNRILRINNRFKKFRISNSFISMVLTVTIVAAIMLVLFFVGYQIVGQLKNFYEYITSQDTINNLFNTTSSKVKELLEGKDNIDPEVMNKINDSITKVVSQVTSLTAVLVQNMINIILSIPTAFLMVIITIIATFFLTKDIDIIQQKIKAGFSEKGQKVIEKINQKKNIIFGGYIKAYSIILLFVCAYSIILFLIAGLKYAVVLGIITAVLDALPIIGAGLVYGILAIISITSGDIKTFIILIIGYIGSIAMRQFLEQKLVSSFLGVHPLVIIIALFLVLTPVGIYGMIYFLGAVLLYEVIS